MARWVRKTFTRISGPPGIQEAIVSQIQGQHAFSNGVPCIRKDGAIIYVEITGTVDHDER